MKKIYMLIVALFFCNKFYAQNEIPILKHSSQVKIVELKLLNSEYRETNINITPDGKFLYFMSDRGGQTWSSYSGYYNGKSRYDGDIWYSEKINGFWHAPVCLSSQINTWSGEDEPNISPDGQRVYYQSWKSNWQSTGGPYYTSELNGKNWGESVGFGAGINRFFSAEYNKAFYYATDGMSVAPDGNTFIVACGPDYEGNMDLYISFKKNNVWIYPKKLNISTDYDERSVFIAGDGRTIFFASDGYGGFGGLDILKATLTENGECINVTNIGQPFNTDKDDYSFIITASGKEAYFSRNGDIYFADLLSENELAPSPTVIVSGRITDCNYKPLEMKLILKDDKNNQIATAKSSEKGDYTFAFPEQEGNFLIYDENKNKLASFSVKTKNTYQEITLNIKNCKTENNSAGGAVQPD